LPSTFTFTRVSSLTTNFAFLPGTLFTNKRTGFPDLSHALRGYCFRNSIAELEKYRRAVREQKREGLRRAMEGKVPAEKAKLVLEFADKVEFADQKLEFSDEKKRDLYDVLTELFSALPKPEKLGDEFDFGDPGKDGADLAKVMLEKL
jgi:hypothetical protein